MSVIIRPAIPTDDPVLIGLYNRVFDGHYSHDVWEWRYRRNPLQDRTFSLVAELDGRVVSHYGATLTRFSLAGRTVTGALYIDAFTDPAVTGLKLFHRLGLALEDDLRAAGVKLLCAFPNEISHRLFYHDLGWRDVFEVPMLRTDRDTLRGSFEPDTAVVTLDSVDERFDALWAGQSVASPAMMLRDGSHINYRFLSSAKNDYTLYTLPSTTGNALLGYCVVKPFEGGLDIMDLLAVDNDSGIRLLDHAVAEGIQKKAGVFNAWLPVRHPLHHHLERRGFENQAPVVYMMAKVIGEIPAGSPDVFDPRVWYYTMGDSDVY